MGQRIRRTWGYAYGRADGKDAARTSADEIRGVPSESPGEWVSGILEHIQQMADTIYYQTRSSRVLGDYEDGFSDGWLRWLTRLRPDLRKWLQS